MKLGTKGDVRPGGLGVVAALPKAVKVAVRSIHIEWEFVGLTVGGTQH
jgi:hypothetical protein